MSMAEGMDGAPFASKGVCAGELSRPKLQISESAGMGSIMGASLYTTFFLSCSFVPHIVFIINGQ